MAVTPSTLTELSDLAKDLFTNFYQPQMNRRTALKAQLDNLERFEFAGKKVIFGLKLETGGGASNAGAHKQLPDNADGSYDQAEVTIVRTYVRMALDNFAIETTKRQSGSFRPAVEEKMDDRMLALDKEINRQMFSAGDGKAALTTTATGAGTAQTIDSAYGVTNGGNPVTHFYKGDQVAFYDNSAALIGRRTISSKSATLGAATGTITVSATVTSVSGGFVTKSTGNDDNYTTGESKGLLSAFVQSGSFQGVPVGSTYQATKFANGGAARPVSDPLVATAVNSAHAQSDEYIDLLVTRPGISQLYSEVFLPIRRINGQEVQLKHGYKPSAVFQHAGGDAPILTDNAAPGRRIFGLKTKYIKLIDLIGQQMFSGDGAQFTRITDEDGVEGFIRKYWQMVWQRLNCHFVIEDVTDIDTVGMIYS